MGNRYEISIYNIIIYLRNNNKDFKTILLIEIHLTFFSICCKILTIEIKNNKEEKNGKQTIIKCFKK